MKVLLVKTSSLGDLIHAMPAVSDAHDNVANLELDWVVEEDFTDLCDLHGNVHRTIPVAFRRWRAARTPGAAVGAAGEIAAFRRAVAARKYDVVIDAQGLYKSAFVVLWTRGRKVGFSSTSIRERHAVHAYHRTVDVPRALGAIERNRMLFAGALGYDLPCGPPRYGVDQARLLAPPIAGRYVVFVHAASWRTKHWPVEHWRALAALVGDRGLGVCLPWLSDDDRVRAEAIAAGFAHVTLIRTDLATIAALIANAEGLVSVETGLAHLGAALGRPGVTLYGPTGVARHGTEGTGQVRVTGPMDCSPCYLRGCIHTSDMSEDPPCMTAIAAREVWSRLGELLPAPSGAGADEL